MKSKMKLILSLVACAVTITAITETASARRRGGETMGGRDWDDRNFTYDSPDLGTAISDTLGGVYAYQWQNGVCVELYRDGTQEEISDPYEAQRSCPRRSNWKQFDNAYCKREWDQVRMEMWQRGYGSEDIPSMRRYCRLGDEGRHYRKRYHKYFNDYEKRHNKKKAKKKKKKNHRRHYFDYEYNVANDDARFEEA